MVQRGIKYTPPLLLLSLLGPSGTIYDIPQDFERYTMYNTAEAQKPGWQGGIAIRKVFARPESFCA